MTNTLRKRKVRIGAFLEGDCLVALQHHAVLNVRFDGPG
jgi:hypothetical protein